LAKDFERAGRKAGPFFMAGTHLPDACFMGTPTIATKQIFE
jgi:hypothetical protein